MVWSQGTSVSSNSFSRSAPSELSFPVVFHTKNCAVHPGNPTVYTVYLPTPRWYDLKAHPFLAIHSADQRPQNCLSSRLAHKELRSSPRESHSFLSLPADTTMVWSQGTSVSSNSFSSWAMHDIFHFKYHFLLHILHFLFFFSDNIIADVATKQQTTALFVSTTVTRKRKHTELKKKNRQTWWETCAVPENIQFSFSCSFFYTVKLHSLT